MATDHVSNAKYAVVEVSALRELTERNADQIISAQEKISDDMLDALEEMIKTARSKKLTNQSALELRAVAW